MMGRMPGGREPGEGLPAEHHPAGPGTTERLLRRLGRSLALRPLTAPLPGSEAAVCPHCWMVNPGAFHLCVRCGADMSTTLQESGGLRWAAPIQSPVPAPGRPRLSVFQRVLVAAFVAIMALSWMAPIMGVAGGGPEGTGTVPASGGP